MALAPMPLDTVSPDTARLGWIGTGVMGASMCSHLLGKGFPVTVYNRTRAKAEPLLAAGAKWADSPKAVAEAADVVFTIVGFPIDVRETVLGAAGTLAGSRPGNILVDMTTSEPALAEEIAARAAERGVVSLDAPVTGGDVRAREARLSIMVGGDEGAFRKLAPCFEAMGKTIVHHGGPGNGQRVKLANQVLIAANMIAICEGLLFAYRAGLDLEAVMKSVSSGGAGSVALSAYGPRMIAGRFEPGFFVEHFLKDMGLALAEAGRMGLALPGLALANQLYLALKSQGHGRDGTHSLILALASLSHVDWMSR